MELSIPVHDPAAGMPSRGRVRLRDTLCFLTGDNVGDFVPSHAPSRKSSGSLGSIFRASPEPVIPLATALIHGRGRPDGP